MNPTFSSASVLLGPGFLGSWQRAVSPLDIWSVSHGNLEGTDVFAKLKAMADGLREGGVLAGFLAYEVAATLEHEVALLPPPAFHGVRSPAVWAGCFAHTECAAAPETRRFAKPQARDEGSGQAHFEGQVAAIREAILAGDLFQANLSRRLSATWEKAPDAQALFGRLVAGTEAPFAALIDTGDAAVLSASPELFLSVTDGLVTAEPIKGTRPRGRTLTEDAALAGDLLGSRKDRAENVMIADLMRNDLARVAQDGSINEEEVCALRTLPSVHHLYSRITARLRPGMTPLDALAAAFPCGSITGAPKVAAMQTIARLEGEGRGPYCGTIFAITHERAVFSVPIRTGVLIRAGGGARLDVRTGGGVTVLSNPAEEYVETEDKAYPFRLMTEPNV